MLFPHHILLPFTDHCRIFFSLFLSKQNNDNKNKQLCNIFPGAYYYLDKPAPIPTLSFDEIIDPQLVDYVKTASVENYNKVVNISSDYWVYLKTAAQNSAVEAKKLWSENFPY